MASQLKTFKTSFSGGLDTRSTLQSLQAKPGFAVKLTNFEQDIGGGYRRINGFMPLSGTALPGSPTTPIRGIHIYRDGVIACSGSDIFHTFDRITWQQVNKDVVSGNLTALQAASSLPRSGSGTYQFDTFTHGAAGGQVDLLIHEAGTAPAILTILGTSDASATYTYKENVTLTDGAVGLVHNDQRIVALDALAPSTFYVSAIADMNDFVGTLSGAFSVADPIIGLKSFRNILYIFCENTVWKAEGLNTSSPNIQPVFKNIGCVDAATIQEVGGDIIFLATDGLRALGATARIGDVSVPTTSLPISGLIREILETRDIFTFTSIVLRERNQYRLFYTNVNDDPSVSKGIIATYYPNKSEGPNWVFSETVGIGVTSAHTSIVLGQDTTIHGNQDGGLFFHDRGIDFDGDPILFEMQTPFFDMGDVGMRKNAREIIFYLEQEGSTSIDMQLRFDYELAKTHQPLVYSLSQQVTPAVWGEMVWGSFAWGSREISIDVLHVSGSFQTASILIQNGSVPISAPFTVQGFSMNYTEGSRL